MCSICPVMSRKHCCSNAAMHCLCLFTLFFPIFCYDPWVLCECVYIYKYMYTHISTYIYLFTSYLEPAITQHLILCMTWYASVLIITYCIENLVRSEIFTNIGSSNDPLIFSLILYLWIHFPLGTMTAFATSSGPQDQYQSWHLIYRTNLKSHEN